MLSWTPARQREVSGSARCTGPSFIRPHIGTEHMRTLRFLALPLLLVGVLLVAGCGGGGSQSVPSTRSPSSAAARSRRLQFASLHRLGEGVVRGPQDGVPEGRDHRLQVSPGPGDHVPRPGVRARAEGEGHGHRHHGQGRPDAAHLDQEAVLQRQRDEVPGAAEGAGSHRAGAAARAEGADPLREAVREGDGDGEGQRRGRSPRTTRCTSPRTARPRRAPCATSSSTTRRSPTRSRRS